MSMKVDFFCFWMFYWTWWCFPMQHSYSQLEIFSFWAEIVWKLTASYNSMVWNPKSTIKLWCAEMCLILNCFRTRVAKTFLKMYNNPNLSEYLKFCAKKAFCDVLRQGDNFHAFSLKTPNNSFSSNFSYANMHSTNWDLPFSVSHCP